MNHVNVAALLSRWLARALTRVVVSLQNMPGFTLLRSPKVLDRLL